MKVKLFQLSNQQFLPLNSQDNQTIHPNLILVFGDKSKLLEGSNYATIENQFPNSTVAICSTAGGIYGNEVSDDTIIVTALEFEKTKVEAKLVNVGDYANSQQAGHALASQMPTDKLCYCLILSDGSLVNGSDLLLGIDEVFKGKYPLTGGLAGDGVNFVSTVVGLNENLGTGNIVAIGFYGDQLEVGHGSMGGWDSFGHEKTITKSSGNVLSEIDGISALDLYKEYLGKYADELPGSALLFPLSLSIEGENESVVRTILSIDTDKKTMTFAGDVPVGGRVRFMKANFDNIIEAASGAANKTIPNKLSKEPDYALLISCVGRKIILKHRIEEEVEAVSEVFNNSTPQSGFYSYGELSPFNVDGKCQLHNQTMTITTFREM